MHRDSYHEYLHNKQKNTIMSSIMNTYVVTCIRTTSQNFLRSYLCNIQVDSSLPPILCNIPYVIRVRLLVIYFLFPFYFRENIDLTDIDHLMLNMESGVIKPLTEKGWSIGQCRTKYNIAFWVDPLASTLWWQHSHGT